MHKRHNVSGASCAPCVKSAIAVGDTARTVKGQAGVTESSRTLSQSLPAGNGGPL